MEENKKTKNIFALLGFILSFIPLFSLVSIVLSIIGLARAKKYDVSRKGFAIAGLIISILGLYPGYLLWVIIYWTL